MYRLQSGMLASLFAQSGSGAPSESACYNKPRLHACHIELHEGHNHMSATESGCLQTSHRGEHNSLVKKGYRIYVFLYKVIAIIVSQCNNQRWQSNTGREIIMTLPQYMTRTTHKHSHRVTTTNNNNNNAVHEYPEQFHNFRNLRTFMHRTNITNSTQTS